MRTRQARHLPKILLMTDERMGDTLWATLAALPRGAGIVFRHHATPVAERHILFEKVRRISRARGLPLLLAGPPSLAVAWKADGAHGRSPHRRAARPLLRSIPCHDGMQLVAGRRQGADLLLLSPAYATRSHPGAPALGLVRMGLMIGAKRGDIVALGGMTRTRGRAMRGIGIARWAAIDGLTRLK